MKGGVEWSAKKERRAQDELDAVATDLMGLGFDLRKDLNAYPARPFRVAPPPLNLAAIIDRPNCPAEGWCITMFRSSRLNEAVRSAGTIGEEIQDAVSDHATIGKKWPGIQEDCPAIAINALKTGNDESEQEDSYCSDGRGWHAEPIQPRRCGHHVGDGRLERLAFVSLLFKRWTSIEPQALTKDGPIMITRITIENFKGIGDTVIRPITLLFS